MNTSCFIPTRVPAWLAATTLAALLAGCGGGDDDHAPPPSAGPGSVPDSALVSSSAYTQFTLTTALAPSETAEPLSADKVMMPPASETDEPVAVN